MHNSKILHTFKHQKVINMKYSPTLQINEQSKKLIASGETVYQLGFGQSPFPVPKSVVEALQTNARQKDYLPVMGLLSLREAIANYYQNKLNYPVSAEFIMIGPGSKELIFLCQMVKNWHVLLPSPSWVSYAPQATYANNKLSWVSTTFENHWQIKAQDLATVCQQIQAPKLLILNYPNNPTGQTYQAEELQEIAMVAKKYKLTIIADEIYERLHFSGEHHSLTTYYPEGTIISSGISKWCGAGGWRLGHFVFPETLRALQNEMAALASETFSCVSAPIQYATIKAYTNYEAMEDYIKRPKIVLQAIAEYMATQFNQVNIKCHNASGGFYLFPDFEAHRGFLSSINIFTSKQLAAYLFNQFKIATLPGSAFGMDESQLCLRLAYVDFDGSTALTNYKQFQKLKQHEKLLEQLIPKLHKATGLICNWLQ